MGFFNVPRAPFLQIDADTIRLEDLLDVDLSHYFDITIDDVNHYVLFNPKIGDLRIQDPDDSDDSDYIQMTTDDASGAILQLSSMITDGKIWEIDHNGTLSGASASATLANINIDLAGVEINDGAANACTLDAILIEASGITATAVGLSTLSGIRIDMPAMHAIYGGLGSAAIYITENTNDCIVEIINLSGNALAISGDDSNTSRDWVVIAPSAQTITADVIHNLISLSAAALTVNDGANTPELRGLKINFGTITATAVDGTIVDGIEITMPDDGVYATETGLEITADKTTDNNARTVITSRDINGEVAGAVALTNYANVLGQAVNHTAGDFIVTQTDATAGILQLNLAHTVIPVTAAPDVFASTALDINVTALVNEPATDEADLDVSARALDITYSITETAGTLQLGTTDVVRISLDDLNFSTAAAMILNALNIDVPNAETLNDANITLQGIGIDFSNITDTLTAKLAGINIVMPDGRAPAIDASQRGTNTGRIEQGAYYYEDDFDNRAAKPEWTARVTTGSTGAAGVSTDLNGVNQIITAGAPTNEESLDWNDIFTFQNTLRPTFEVRVYLEDVGNDSNYAFGLVNTNIITGQPGLALNQGGAANFDFIIIELSHTTHGDALWHLSSQLNGVSTVDDGAAAAATTWTTLRFEFITDTTAEWFIDGVSQGTVLTNIPTDPLQPLLFVLTDAGATRYVDIDYVKIWQDRA